eukprot:UN09732
MKVHSPELHQPTRLIAWGSGINGNIAGLGFKSTATPQEILLPDESISKIFTNASESAFALTQNGSLYSWGRGENYVLGNGQNLNTSIPQLINIPKVRVLSTFAVSDRPLRSE